MVKDTEHWLTTQPRTGKHLLLVNSCVNGVQYMNHIVVNEVSLIGKLHKSKLQRMVDEMLLMTLELTRVQRLFYVLINFVIYLLVLFAVPILTLTLLVRFVWLRYLEPSKLHLHISHTCVKYGKRILKKKLF